MAYILIDQLPPLLSRIRPFEVAWRPGRVGWQGAS